MDLLEHTIKCQRIASLQRLYFSLFFFSIRLEDSIAVTFR
jgi:hypothetical protein